MIDDLKESGNDKFEGYGENHNWTHKSCIWELPYAKTLILPHNISYTWRRVNGRRTRSFKKTSSKITRSSKEKYLKITMND
jgi:hypothetical protein